MRESPQRRHAALFVVVVLAPVLVAGVPPDVVRWGLAAAAAVTGLCALGSAYAVAVVGGAAVGAVAEKPELAGRALVFVGLAEGIAIYGLIVAIMILERIT
jgi:V/A-type H+-transporting ATPase subunit K